MPLDNSLLLRSISSQCDVSLPNFFKLMSWRLTSSTESLTTNKSAAFSNKINFLFLPNFMYKLHNCKYTFLQGMMLVIVTLVDKLALIQEMIEVDAEISSQLPIYCYVILNQFQLRLLSKNVLTK